MTHRERIGAALSGRAVDCLPWAPRLDLWYASNASAGTLPPGLQGQGFAAVLEMLDCGRHAVIPDFRAPAFPDADLHTALGFYNARSMPLSVVLEGVDSRVERGGEETTVTYRTPHGTVRTRVRYDEGMRRAGVSLGHVSERAIKGSEDYRPVAWIFEHASVIPNPAGFAELERVVADRGVAVGYASPAASPMHHLLHLLMPFDLLYYELVDNPAGLAACADAVGGFMERLLEAAAGSAAGIVFWGGNFDTTLTPPPFFRTHILPWLSRAAARLHAAGKKLLSHPDGENSGLLEMYREAGMDVADSICPAPMTKLSLAEVRKVFGRDVAILGGIPSIVLLPGSMPEAEFDRFLDGFFTELGEGARLVLGVSDTTPPGAEFGRLAKIGERARAFGPVPGTGD